MHQETIHHYQQLLENKNQIIQNLLKANSLFEQQLVAMESFSNDNLQPESQDPTTLVTPVTTSKTAKVVMMNLQAENEHLTENVTEMEREMKLLRRENERLKYVNCDNFIICNW